MKLHIDGRKFDTKPENADIAGIKWRFTKPGSIHDLTVAQIANALMQGYTIEPGVCPYSEQTKAKGKSGTSDADFAEQTLFMVDIDNKRTDVERTTPEQAVAALAEYSLPLAFAYPTFHSTDEQERFRIALVSDEVFTDRIERDRVQAALIKLFPQSDTDCKNADRIFFGTDKPLYDGIGDLNAVCRKADLLAFADSLLTDEPKTAAAAPVPAQNMNVPFVPAANGKTIPEGQRNTEMHTFAVKVLKKFGAADGRALEAYQQQACKCSPALDDKELAVIWNSALHFYANTICADPDYIPPKEYNAGVYLRPEHFTDVDEAATLAEQCESVLRFSDATGWLYYDGKVWKAGEQLAHGCMHDLTERQLESIADDLKEVNEKLRVALEAYTNAQFDPNVPKPEVKRLKDEAAKAGALAEVIEKEEKFYLKCRGSSTIKNVLTEAQTFLWLDVAELDKDPLLLNTPAGTVELRTGVMREHNPLDYCTKITNVAPDQSGAELFRDFLHNLTSGDSDTQRYLQETAGMFLVGAVYLEKLTIAHGEGGNGKSTFFNLLVRVMGSYAGYIASDVLIASNRNKAPEYAELRGKRLVVAGETEEGVRLDTATVKRLCSTDSIRAEAKYHAPFDFVPAHSTVLYTNHLPKVGSIDRGTWDRLVIVPFTHRFRGTKTEVLNYAEYLFDHCGGAVLAWMIEGAKRFLQNQKKIELPAVVKAAIANYRNDNDWLNNFLAECCKQNETYSEKSGELYQRYRAYSERTGEYIRNAPDFKAALSSAGFTTVKTSAGMVVKGLRLLTDAENDFLPPLSNDKFVEYSGVTPWG